MYKGEWKTVGKGRSTQISWLNIYLFVYKCDLNWHLWAIEKYILCLCALCCLSILSCSLIINTYEHASMCCRWSEIIFSVSNNIYCMHVPVQPWMQGVAKFTTEKLSEGMHWKQLIHIALLANIPWTTCRTSYAFNGNNKGIKERLKSIMKEENTFFSLTSLLLFNFFRPCLCRKCIYTQAGGMSTYKRVYKALI